METANAARDPPNASRGMEYILTLKAATAKKLTEIPTQLHAALGDAGIATVASESNEATTQTRYRDAIASLPRPIQRKESHPPAMPPAAAKTGGIQAYHAAWTFERWCTSTR